MPYKQGWETLVMGIILLWQCYHPVVKSLTVMSSSKNESIKKHTFICDFIVLDIDANSKCSNTSIKESFSEFVHYRKNYNTQLLINSDSLAWVTIALKSNKVKNQEFSIEGFGGHFPIYRKLFKLPLPDSIPIVIKCHSHNINYLLKKK